MAKDRSLVIALIGIVVLAAVYGAIFSGDLSGAATAVCKETDGGKIYLVAGNTTLGRTTSKDACIDNTRLKEFYCNRNKIDFTTYNCALQNKVCKNGACVACVDSDGMNTYTRGSIKYLGTTSWDKCYDPISGKTVNNSNWLAEMYCTSDGQGAGQTQTFCANGCINGACIKGDCDVESTLRTASGFSTKTYTVNGFDYEITLVMVDKYKNTAKFSVNGIVTKELAIGESFVQGFKIKLAYITADGGETYSVLFCFTGETTEPPTPPYSCPAGGFTDTLKDGETKTYTINGIDYEITGVFIDSHDHTAKFSVNGVMTKALTISEYAITGDTKLMVSEIMANQREGMVTFCFAPTTEPENYPYTCEQGGVIDSLRNQETKTYTLNGLDYEISPVFITSDQYRAKFSVNGLFTKELTNGESVIVDLANLRVLEVLSNEREGMVTFCLSAVSNVCGDGIRYQMYEQCDGTDLGPNTCIGSGFVGGTLKCKADCTLDTSGCVRAAYCGDGIVQKPNSAGFIEVCDGTDMNGNQCTDFGFTGGTLACNSNCEFYYGECTELYACNDTDGDNIFTKGYVYIGPAGYVDACFYDNTNTTTPPIGEMLCVRDGNGLFRPYRRITDCPSSYSCIDGACKNSSSPCTDSDGGQVFGVKGYVTYEGFIDYSTGELIKEWDACAGSILREKYCAAPTSIGLRDYACPNGCSDGACI